MNEQEKPDEKAAESVEKSPTVVSQTNKAVAEKPATEQQLKKTETQIEVRMSAFERSMVRLTVAGVIIAGITLVIFIGQWCEMREAGRDTKNLSDAAQTQATAATNFSGAANRIDTKIGETEQAFKTMADSARQSQKDTAQQLVTIQKQFRLDQRPIVWVASAKATLGGEKPIHLDIEPGEPFQSKILVTVIFTNVGKSPAQILWQKRGIATGADALTSVRLAEVLPNEDFLPNGSTDFMVLATDAMKNQKMVEALGTNNGVVIKAQFHYRDSLGSAYESDICWKRAKNDVWSACEPNRIKDCTEEHCDRK